MPFLNVSEGRVVSRNRKGHKLTPKMLEFIDLYLIHMNAAKAVELSSYNTKNPNGFAIELMQHPLIRAEVDKRLVARSERSEVTAEFLIQKLLNIIDNTEINNPNAALRAIELAGKSIALWKDRQEISGPDGQAIRHEQDIKESVADFTTRIQSLAKRQVPSGIPSISERTGTDNIVEFPDRGAVSETALGVELLEQAQSEGSEGDSELRWDNNPMEHMVGFGRARIRKDSDGVRVD